ncbi:MAG: SAM-dependent methyltransferase [Erysipelotrichaceae bacterium]|nr:SAM-dependent methyltransferase [Erysipelotrichaceae bacterium]
MKLTNKIINLITTEYNAFKDYMYANSPKDIRDNLGQFFTPSNITIQMLDLYDDLSVSKILDPCSGSGNLLAAAIIAGAGSNKVFGNDYDVRMVRACRERIRTIPDRLETVDKTFADELREKLKSFNDWQIHKGDATDSFCLTYFGPDYKQKLEEHYLNSNIGPYAFSLLDAELTDEQKEFLREVD